MKRLIDPLLNGSNAVLITLATDGLELESNNVLAINAEDLNQGSTVSCYVTGADSVAAQIYTKISPEDYKQNAKNPAEAWELLQQVITPSSVLVGYGAVKFTAPFFNKFLAEATVTQQHQWLDLMYMARVALSGTAGMIKPCDYANALTEAMGRCLYDTSKKYSLEAVAQRLKVCDGLEQVQGYYRNLQLAARVWRKLMELPVPRFP